MASEPPERHPVPVRLPRSLDEWLADRADTADVDREELLVQLAATYRAAVEDGDATPDLVHAVEDAAIEAATERVDDRLGSFRSSLDSQLQAIRKRIVQLKHESDEKAEAKQVRDLSTKVEGVERSVDDIETALESLDEEVEELSTEASDAERSTGTSLDGSDDAARGDPIGRLDDVESKLVRVARAVVELRDDEGGTLHDATFRELRRVAAREGVREATCADCEARVDVALLAERVCPHCERRFRELAVDTPHGEPRLVVEDDGETDDGTEETPRGKSSRTEPTGRGESNADTMADER